MTSRPLDVGVLVHDAGRTGAPIVLLRVLQELVASSTIRPRFVIKQDGELVEAFQAMGPVLVLGAGRALRLPPGPVTDRINELAVAPRRRTVRRFLAGVDLVYSNTVVNGEVLKLVAGDIPVVTHVHELPRFLASFTSPSALQATIERTSVWIAVSDAVTHMLVGDWGIAAKRVALVRECVDRKTLDHSTNRQHGNEILGVTDDAWVIGCVGTIDRRKGADLFPILASRMLKQSAARPLAFRWMGGRAGTPDYEFAVEDVRRMGLADHVRYVGNVTEPMDAIGRFDVHVLLSREDPYPLVMLEAAARGRPTICFEGAGGGPEFVGRGAGSVVPYMDVAAVAAAAFEHLSAANHPLREAQCRRLAAEHTAERAARQIRDVLNAAAGRTL